MRRKKCRVCFSEDLKQVLSLGAQALSDFVDTAVDMPKYDLTLLLCGNCKLVQLAETVDPSLLYTPRYGYRSGINQTMRNHLAEIAMQADELAQPLPGEIVIDIGCNDGTLLKSYTTEDISRTGFDPVGKFHEDFKGTNIGFVHGYFNRRLFQALFGNRKAQIITAISMFYDLDDPNEFVFDLKETLDDGGVIVIQQNYLVGMMLQNAFDNIVHEHLEYYSLLSLEKLLERHALSVFKVELNDLNGGSFRTYICHEGDRPTDNSVIQLRDSELQMGLDTEKPYLDFGKRIEALGGNLTQLVETEVEKGKTVYVYGASTRGNTLLQYSGLDKNLIKAAVERNKEKWGKKIASVGIPIISEEQARKEKPDYMLVLPWFFKDEFLKREKKYLDGGGKFIFPLPNLEVVGNDS